MKKTLIRTLLLVSGGWSFAFGHPGGAGEHAGKSGRSLILEEIDGRTGLDARVREAQRLLADKQTEQLGLDRLGWLFIEKARAHGDASFYWRAEACADLMEIEYPEHVLDAKLLRGHVLHQRHQFRAALALAEDVVAERGQTFDLALLGDVFLDLGEVDRAAEAYQKMIDLKPGVPSYLRGAELRWLVGDVDGCLEMMLQAVKAGSSRQPESLAWSYSRLSHFLVAAGKLREAGAAADRALELSPNYLPGLVAKGRVLLGLGEFQSAYDSLQLVCEVRGEPFERWLAWECVTSMGRHKEAVSMKKNLMAHGQREDPRTVALLLATLGEGASVAVTLAKAELLQRQDVYTHDALAWALFAQSKGKPGELLDQAWAQMESALAYQTPDARLGLHAGLILNAMGRPTDAQTYLSRADTFSVALLPSERRLLSEAMSALFINAADAAKESAHRERP